MKKNFLILSIIAVMSGSIAFADGMVFDPTEYNASTAAPAKTTTAKTTAQKNITIEENTKASSSYAQNSISGQSTSLNNALFELDSAQVNIRNDLLDYQAKYQEVDTQYKLIKEQRRVLDEQIKSIERRIKDLERSKNQIRKTMI